MAARILSDGKDVAGDIAGHTGIAYSIAGLLRAFPIHAARHQLYVPADVLERHHARSEDIFAGHVTPELRAALAVIVQRGLSSKIHVGEYAGWGFFDYRMEGEGFRDGYQSMPADWGISSPRKAGSRR